MNKIEIVAAVVSIVVSLLGFFLSVRAELKKHNDEFIKRQVDNERRHSAHNRKIYHIEQKILSLDSFLTLRLNELTKRTDELYELFIDYIRGNH